MDKIITNVLFPEPKKQEYSSGCYSLPSTGVVIFISQADQFQLATRLKYHFVVTACLTTRKSLLELGISEICITATLGRNEKPNIYLSLSLSNNDQLKRQKYMLDVEEKGITVVGHGEPGLFYGVATLIQVLQAVHYLYDKFTLPCLHIEDEPDFIHRGAMLDISRDKVPTLQTVLDLVDQLASWKINQLQLYVEHTFAYRGHDTVWKDASPFTGEEIMELDKFCKERHVELVPNQNSFGHLHRWFKHPQYAHLAECPEGVSHPFSTTREPYSLCPTDALSLEFLDELYSQLLPHFSSRQFNVGLDETFDLGQGRSKEVCDSQGVHPLYVKFLQQVHGLTVKHGRRMQYWGDIVLERPELIPLLPKEAVALIWGYEKSHPYAFQCSKFAEHQLPFYVCPGTSSWNTVVGRTDNCIENIRNAAVNGVKHGAEGLLITDWGDFGHMQPLPVSFLGFFVGAGLSWTSTTIVDKEKLCRLLNLFVFRDRQDKMGKIMYDLGNVYLSTGEIHANGTMFGRLCENATAKLPNGVTYTKVIETKHILELLLEQLNNVSLKRPDASIIQAEMRVAVDMVLWAADLAAERLKVKEAGEDDTVLHNIAVDRRNALSSNLSRLLDPYQSVWKSRNRTGGLMDSLKRLENNVSLLQTAK